MRKLLLIGAASLSYLALLSAAGQAKALMIAPAAISQRVALAEVVVIGKVTSIEEKPILAARFPGDKEKGEYRVAVVKIDKALVGASDLTHVRVGFQPPAPQPAPPPGGGVRIPIRRGPQLVTLTVDQEVCLFLTPHSEASFFIAANYYDVIGKKDNANFDKEIAEAARSAKLLANSKAGLQSKDAEDRLLTAAMLVHRYRTPKPSPTPPKTKPVDAETSKLILRALAAADWSPNKPGRFNMVHPQNTFFQLGITPTDGFQPPMDFNKVPELAKKWLTDHAETYRIQRFVADKDDGKGGK